MQGIILSLPKRFQWTLHNVVAHPVMEILTQVGLSKLGTRVHDATLPNKE